jgi:hypothetical protein
MGTVWAVKNDHNFNNLQGLALLQPICINSASILSSGYDFSRDFVKRAVDKSLFKRPEAVAIRAPLH